MLTTELALLSILTIQLVVVCLTFGILFTKIHDFFNIWVLMRTSTNFAHLPSFQATEFVGWPILKTLDILSDKRKQSFLYKTQHSVTLLLFTKNKQTISFSSPVSTLSARTASHFDPHFATKKKNGLHYLTQASFTDAQWKQKANY